MHPPPSSSPAPLAAPLVPHPIIRCVCDVSNVAIGLQQEARRQTQASVARRGRGEDQREPEVRHKRKHHCHAQSHCPGG